MSPLKRYLLTRAASFVITVFAAATLTFIIPRMVPSDPISANLARLSEMGMGFSGGEELVKAYMERFGFNEDLFTQYTRYWWNLLHGDLGISITGFPMTVQQVISYSIGYTIALLSFSVIVSWLLGNILGALVGWHRGGRLDATITPICLVLYQIPYYFLALALVFALAYVIPLFPIGGAFTYGSLPKLTLEFIADYLYHATLPALSIVMASMAGSVIGMRAMLVNVLGEDYLMLAEAKGLRKRTILMRYGFRNALLPSMTGLAMSLGFMTSGALLTEIVFRYPGLGNTLVLAVTTLDYNLIQGIFLLTTVGVLGANLLMDFLYPLIDPRITYTAE